MASKKQYYSADEATALLKVAKGTLYSYVSRGLVRSEEEGGKTRARRYLAEDVDTLVERKQQRKNPERVAKAALHWGAPVLESALTAIDGDSLFYRGHDATTLAVERRFEEVANLLWLGEWGSEWPLENVGSAERLWNSMAHLIKIDDLLAGPFKSLEAFQIVLPAIGAADLTAYTLDHGVAVRTARQIIQVMTHVVTNGMGINAFGELSVAGALQQAWIPDAPDAPNALAVERMLNAMLILCADHELNVSSFTVRCVASAKSSPYAAVVAGLSALQGPLHGGASELVELLLKETESNVHKVMTNRLKRGEAIPGFGHPLYAEADPRCRALLDLADEHGGNKRVVETAQTIIDMVATHVGKAPNVDFGLTVLCKALDLPEGAPLTLFALGRTAGWMGHYIEQIQSNTLIRPRATYVGERAKSKTVNSLQ